ncbi:MAG: hypothetical protein RSD36_06500 [Terrisporobacter sp.]
MIWEFKHDKYHTVKYFSHKFAQKQSELALLFYINRLCYAKIKYFDKNIDKYEPYKYVFLMHKPSRSMIDIRKLKDIKNINEFKEFCSVLESLEGQLN